MKSPWVAQYERLEKEHWWWLARRSIVAATLKRLLPHKTDSLLDVGCGAGLNLKAYANQWQCSGLEPDTTLAAAARTNSGVEVLAGSVPGNHPYQDRTFNAVMMLDVIEHIDDDIGALRDAAELTTPEGHILINVPAMPWLWSVHDEVNEHKRRYTRATLRAAINEAGLELQSMTCWGIALAPAAFLARRLFGRSDTAENYTVGVPRPFINSCLRALILLEYHLLRWLPIPVGLSLLAVARRKK
jgi:SAM-dependent methyltransferase